MPSNCDPLTQRNQQNSSLDDRLSQNVSLSDESTLKLNRTTVQKTQCLPMCTIPSNINHLTEKVNAVPDLPDVPEMAIPESVDIVESSTAFKRPKLQTTKLVPTEQKSDPISTVIINNNNLSQAPYDGPITNDKLTSFELSTPQPDSNKVNNNNRIAVQAEQPIEIRELPVSSQNVPAPITQSTIINKVAGVLHSLSKQNKTKTDAEIKQQDVELDEAQLNTDKFHENDIKINFNKKTPKFDKTNADVDVEAGVGAGVGVGIGPVQSSTKLPNVDSSPSSSSSTTITSTSAASPASKSNCILIYLFIRSETFNITLGSDEICHSFNVTYNIPISMFMKENRFELIFVYVYFAFISSVNDRNFKVRN